MDLSRFVSRKSLAALAAFIAVLAGGGTLVLTADPDDKGAAPATVTVSVDGLDAGAAPDRTLEVPKAAVKQAAAVVEDGLRSEADATPGDLAEHSEIAREQDALSTAGATQGFEGCRTSFVSNQSSRRGVRPQQMWLHYTVSPNRPGWSDVNAIVAFFDSPKAQASSHFVIDREGNCAYIVPIEAKAWTQAAANPIAVSWEVINSGSEGSFMSTPGYRVLSATMREVSRRTGIPMRRSSEKGCAGATRGILEHRDGGICAGGHTDIGPYSIDTVVKLVTAIGGVTETDRVTCRKLNWWRRAGRPQGEPQRNASRRRAALTKRGVVCTARGRPVRS